MENIENKLREEAKKLLADKKIDILVGYENGSLPLTATPCFITNPDEAERLVWNQSCSHNLAKFVHDIIQQNKDSQKRIKPEDRKKKIVGVVAKGCTTRSLIIHLQERQYDKSEIVIIGVPCSGYIDRKKLAQMTGSEDIIDGKINGKEIFIKTPSHEKSITIDKILSDNCLTCRFNNPVLSDVLIGEKAPAMAIDQEYEKVETLEKLANEDRFAYFEKEFKKCIRCYACRQACPSCYCRICFVEQTQPQFVALSTDNSDTQIFQMLRLFHMVGRCVDCGSCINACPMGVDLRAYLKKLDKDALELFEHRAGLSMDEVPPLSTYRENDKEDFIYHP